MKDDPAVAGLMIWNENDLTGHFDLSFLPDNKPWHRNARLLLRSVFATSRSPVGELAHGGTIMTANGRGRKVPLLSCTDSFNMRYSNRTRTTLRVEVPRKKGDLA